MIDGGALRWDEDIDVCYDAVRARLLGLPKDAELDEIWAHRSRVYERIVDHPRPRQRRDHGR